LNNPILTCALLIFLLPLAAYFVMALLNRRIPRRGDFFATSVLGACLLLSLYVFWAVLHSSKPILVNVTFDWLPMQAGKALAGGLMVDRLTAVMLVVVTLVSFLVHLFSVKYLEGDVRYGRYFTCLLLFTTSMLGLVLANNLLYLYMFWELVGLSSYLLIGHWFEKKSASDAAIKAFITTRLGDVGMFVGIMICYFQVGSLHYADVFQAVETGGLAGSWRTIAGLGLFFGAMGKSAQFPLHVWLPDAMEGPTPVSALIHAATMVAAGVYLVGRLLPVFDPTTLLVIAYVGGFTALFAATIALVQDDIKKVLAYSTVSQLGYMILALGVGGYTSGLFHLTTHACFKAGLFLGSGAVIYAMHHEQSLSKYGGLRRKMPYTAFFYLLATLALTGFPGFSGFWSKDAILADALGFSMVHPAHAFLPFAGFATVFLTAFYMFRQYFLTFTGKPRDQHAYDHAHEVPWQMLVPLVVLGSLAVVGGGFGHWFGVMNPKRPGMEQVRSFVEAGPSSFATSSTLSTASTQHAGPDEADAHEQGTDEHGAAAHGSEGSVHSPEVAAAHKAHYPAMLLSTILGLGGILLGGLMYLQRGDGTTVLNPATPATRFAFVHRLLWNKYYLDEFYMACFVMSTRAVSRLVAVFDRTVIDGIVNFFGWLGVIWSYLVELADRLVVDGLGVNGSAWVIGFAGEKLSYSQTGRVRQYLVLTAAGMVILAGLCGIVSWLL
jgi:NADH-quinone oxidoreductase subunit L